MQKGNWNVLLFQYIVFSMDYFNGFRMFRFLKQMHYEIVACLHDSQLNDFWKMNEIETWKALRQYSRTSWIGR